MTWLTRIQDELIVTTGDGKTYKPQWLNSSYSVDYNVTQFDFVGVQGSLVVRKEPKATEYPIEWYFTGEDHLETSEAFKESAKDKRAWTVIFPFYGSKIVQPVRLNFDDTAYNITKISGSVLETITDDNPKTVYSPVDKIVADKAAMDELSAANFADQVVPDTSDKNMLTSNNTNLYNTGVKSVKNNIDSESYFNLFNTANSKIINATGKPLDAIRATQAAINYPLLFSDSVKNRLATLLSQFDILRNTVKTITTRSGKKIYENNGAAIISSMAVVSATPQSGDYGNKTQVLQTVGPISDSYNSYLTDLDSLQSDNGGKTGNYIPDPDTLIALNDLMNYTISNLFTIALGAKQERSIILENDSDPIMLTHRFYGLDVDDLNMNQLISQNNFGLNELLLVRKGRNIIYYV